MKLRIRESDYEEIRRLTALSFRADVEFPPETGCILLLSRNEHPLNPSLVVAEVLSAEDGELTECGADGLTFCSDYLRRALLEVRRRSLAGFLTVHTHPLSTSEVRFSLFDDENDPSLMDNLHEVQPEGVFGSVVLGQSSAAGRIWNPADPDFKCLSELVVVGESICSIPLDGTAPRPPMPSALFDRATAVTGSGALAMLSRMRIGIVGAGGTGSLMVELAARAGVGEIFIFDFDHAEETNLNRVLHLRQLDVDSSASKAARLGEAVEEAGLPCRIVVIDVGDIRESAIAYDLLACDVLIGCIDRDWPRLILNEVCNQYLIPYIDIGTEIGIVPDGISSLDVRASYVSADRPCLLCAGLISPERIRLEGFGEPELERVLAMGYSADFRITAPAVMDLNMRAASWAMLLLRHLLQPFLVCPLPHSIRESVTNFSTRTRFHARCATCSLCGNRHRLGSAAVFPLTTRGQRP
jgi:hypothetical protein